MRIKRTGLKIAFVFFFSFAFAGSSDADDLMTKIMFNDIEGVKELLAAGADVNEKDEQHGSTPLMMASGYQGYEEMVKLLLENGADPNMQDKVRGSTALIAAAGVSQRSVEMLLAHGADIKIKQFNGEGAFTSCISGILMERVTTDLAKLLLSNGADVNEAPTSGPTEGYPCLMMAARNNAPDLVKFLIENGADINAKAKDGSTALSLAKKENDAAMVKLLEELGAK